MTSTTTETSQTETSQEGGQLWVQTGPLGFNSRALTTTYALVPEVPALKIPFPGVWAVSYHARASFQWNERGSLWVTTALYKNNEIMRGSEAVSGMQFPEWQGTVPPAGQLTAGQTFLQSFDTGDVVTLHAHLNGVGFATIVSQDDGRTGVMAHWVSPAF
ncbi:hypothetical protein ACIGXM_31615 [Kitasatospora sp. NPDC052896]|uniref:hypothetical protein n=1 Tax=Kitasatospora sp. NPDC052896 TaxID=3364061 RepID=UPI0037C76E49